MNKQQNIQLQAIVKEATEDLERAKQMWETRLETHTELSYIIGYLETAFRLHIEKLAKFLPPWD